MFFRLRVSTTNRIAVTFITSSLNGWLSLNFHWFVLTNQLLLIDSRFIYHDQWITRSIVLVAALTVPKMLTMSGKGKILTGKIPLRAGQKKKMMRPPWLCDTKSQVWSIFYWSQLLIFLLSLSQNISFINLWQDILTGTNWPCHPFWWQKSSRAWRYFFSIYSRFFYLCQTGEESVSKILMLRSNEHLRGWVRGNRMGLWPLGGPYETTLLWKSVWNRCQMHTTVYGFSAVSYDFWSWPGLQQLKSVSNNVVTSNESPTEIAHLSIVGG